MRSGKDPLGDIEGIARQFQNLHQQAVKEYAPLVETILREGKRDTRLIEHTLDGLLDFCGYDPAVELFRRLCRHYWEIDPEATAHYVQAYREMWDSD